MDNPKRVLVVSTATRECKKAFEYGLSVAQKYGAELSVLHIVYNPFGLKGWVLNIPNLIDLEAEYEKMIQQAKADLDAMIQEAKSTIPVKEILKRGNPAEEVIATVTEEKADMIIMVAHEEGRIEHFIYSKYIDAIVRALPCSIFLVKVSLDEYVAELEPR